MAANDQKTKVIEVTIPISLHAQLLHLARHSPLGVTPTDVARSILVERVMALMGDQFRDTVPPFDRPTTGEA